VADDLLIKTEQHMLWQQYDRNDIKHCAEYNFLTYANDDKN